MTEEQDGGRPVKDDDNEWMSRLAEGLAAAAAAQPEMPAALPPLPSDGNVHQLRAAFAADAHRAASALDAVYAPADEIDLLLRDVEEAERARDALAETPSPPLQPEAASAAMFKLRRTSDSVPIILGSVIGVLMIVVFATAATFVRFARWQ